MGLSNEISEEIVMNSNPHFTSNRLSKQLSDEFDPDIVMTSNPAYDLNINRNNSGEKDVNSAAQGIEDRLPSLKEQQQMVAEKFGDDIEISIGGRPSLKDRQQMIADKFGATIKRKIGESKDRREAEIDLEPMEVSNSTMKLGG